MGEKVLEKRPHLISAILAALMLLGPLGQRPYGYYQLPRFVVCSAGGYAAFVAYESEKMWATWLFGIIAVLFNPLIPIYLSGKLWQPIDVVCALLFVGVAAVVKARHSRIKR